MNPETPQETQAPTLSQPQASIQPASQQALEPPKKSRTFAILAFSFSLVSALVPLLSHVILSGTESAAGYIYLIVFFFAIQFIVPIGSLLGATFAIISLVSSKQRGAGLSISALVISVLTLIVIAVMFAMIG